MLHFLNRQISRPWFRQSAKIAVSISLLAYCLSLVDLSELPGIFARCDFSLVVLAFIFTLLGTIVAKAVILWVLLPSTTQVTVPTLISLNLALRFYTMILPKAVVAGIRWNKYRNLSDGQTSLVILSFETLLALCTATICALIFMYSEDSLTVPLQLKYATLLLFVVFITCAAVLFFYPNSQLLTRAELFLGRYKLSNFVGKLIKKWRESVLSLNLKDRTVLYPVFLSSLLGHLTFLLGGYILFLSLHSDVSFVAVAWIRSAVFVLVSVPISFAGIGIRELGFIYLFGLYGVDSSEIIVYAMLALIVQASIAAIGFVIEIKHWLAGA